MEEILYASQECLCVDYVRATEDYQLEIRFNDGARKRFDFRPLLDLPIYEALKSPSLFCHAETDGCGVVWNDDIDIDPTYLYRHGADMT